MANSRLQGFPRGGQPNALLTVPVKDGGHEALMAEPTALAGTGTFSEGDVDRVAHEKLCGIRGG
jgi:hypothetical protein